MEKTIRISKKEYKEYLKLKKEFSEIDSSIERSLADLKAKRVYEL